MIKANELRLGNYVWNEIQNIPVKVTLRIIEDQIYAQGGYKDSWKPIPLTEEILLKCGFEKIYYGFNYDNKLDFVLRRDKIYLGYYDDDCWCCIGENIKNLHQLQNLYFSLTGEELEVKL